MRLGVFGLLQPDEVGADKRLEWSIEEAAKLEVEVIGGDSRAVFHWGEFPCDRGYWRELRSLGAAHGLEIEPYVRSPFDLIGPGSAQARAAMVDSLRAAVELGGPVMRTAYGNNTVALSRFGPTPLPEHLKHLESNLKEAAKLAESEGVFLAIENHCDFSGRELASVFAHVDSERIRCALDTGNGMTIFCDPMDDAEALARWTVTTHIKDMKVIEHEGIVMGRSTRVPFGLIGCPIGEGHVDVLAIIQRLIKECPLHARVPLIIEPSWPSVASGEDFRTKRNEMLFASLRNLRQLVQSI